MKLKWAHGLCALSVVIGVMLPAAAQESAHFKIERLGPASGAGNASSISFETRFLVSQLSPAGAASVCNVGARTSFGFWSIYGHLDVPILLELDRDTADTNTVDLSWSGSHELFEVYRAFSPENVVDFSNLHEGTVFCHSTDGQADEADLVFYRVVPGPDFLAKP